MEEGSDLQIKVTMEARENSITEEFGVQITRGYNSSGTRRTIGVGVRICWWLGRLVVPFPPGGNMKNASHLESNVGFGRSDVLRKSFVLRLETHVSHRRVCDYTCYCEATVPPKDGSKYHIGFPAHFPQPCNSVCHPHVTFH